MKLGTAAGRDRRTAPAIVAGLASCLLGGCVEQAADVAPNATALRAPLEKREGVSLAAATVAIVSVEGAPAVTGSEFTGLLRDDARRRDIVLADANTARYLVRGYLSATAVQDGAEIEYVWDVFGPDKRRAFRLNDVLDVKGAGDDPWAIVTDAALKSVADRSADDLAAFLSQTPEAKQVSEAKPVSEGKPVAGGPSGDVSYASTQ